MVHDIHGVWRRPHHPLGEWTVRWHRRRNARLLDVEPHFVRSHLRFCLRKTEGVVLTIPLYDFSNQVVAQEELLVLDFTCVFTGLDPRCFIRPNDYEAHGDTGREGLLDIPTKFPITSAFPSTRRTREFQCTRRTPPTVMVPKADDE